MLNYLTKRIDFSGASAILQKTTDKLYRQRIIFVHVPKSGGTSLSQALRLRYLLSHFRVREEASGEAAGDLGLNAWMDFKKRLIAYHAEVGFHYLQGHIPIDTDFMQRYSSTYNFITILRNPVERVVSHFFFEQRLRDMGPEEFLASERCDFEARVLCHFFGELPWEETEIEESAINLAVANLEKFGAVGILENLDPFYQDIERITGRRILIAKRNVGRNKSNEILPDGFIEEVGRKCSADMRIYEHFRQIAASKSTAEMPKPESR